MDTSILEPYKSVEEEFKSATIKKEPVPYETLVGVFYTDGGYRSDKELSAWGVHGYIGTTMPNSIGSGLSSQYVTDIGYVEKSDEIGLGDAKVVSVIRYFDFFDTELGTVETKVSQNTAEVQGIIAALAIANLYKITQVVILSDSKYALRAAYMKCSEWSQNGWKKADGDQVANLKFMKLLWEQIQLANENGIDVRYDHVRGHTGILGNERADMNCTAAMNLFESTETSQLQGGPKDARGYWNYKTNYHRFLSDSLWYFTRDMIVDENNVYYIGNHGDKEIYAGKPIADASLAAIKLKEPDPVLQEILKVSNDIPSASGVYIANLSNILKPAVQQMVLDYSGNLTRYVGSKKHLETPNHLPLVRDMSPPRLAHNIFPEFNALEYHLDNAIAGKDTNSTCITDITNYFYMTTETKGKKKVTYLLGDTTSVTVSARHIGADGVEYHTPLILTIDLDTPKKNTLSGIASEETQVFLLTVQEEVKSFRYYVAVRNGDDWGLWGAVYANLKVVI